ncbi:hypothetical protein [Citrobacter arsenatis]|uniref:hypothetical protein n=1 Tax=Citrobacter arsenatis TaxID=2546350 RepID=UPI00300E4229
MSVKRLTGGYTITAGGRTQPLKLTTTRAGYGVRYWYCCPCCGRRCAVLYVTHQQVACRQCCGLHYASQSESTQERMMRSVYRRRLALWGRFEPLSVLGLLPMSPYLFMKPPRMHWQTFEARRGEVMDYERRFWKVEKAILTRLFTNHDGAR